jgi:hypothetical protein
VTAADAKAPHRIRLYGGRNVHGARPLNDDLSRLVTTCSQYLVGTADSRLADDTDVTCRFCLREMNR